MENLTFVDEENIPLIIQDADYDNYSTPDTTPSRVDETSLRCLMPSKQHQLYD